MYSYFSAGIAPFGQMPLLEVDGTIIAQSMAIARFVANEVGTSRMLILNRNLHRFLPAHTTRQQIFLGKSFDNLDLTRFL